MQEVPGALVVYQFEIFGQLFISWSKGMYIYI